MALHGWLDNCASFYRLAPLLAPRLVAAPDAAGHGRSDWRGADSDYAIWRECTDILALADALGWRRFAIVGHSRGAIAGFLCAAAAPQRVAALHLIDGILPLTVRPQDAAAHLARMVHSRAATATLYASREAAINARMNSDWPVPRAAAEALAQRAVRRTPGGWHWHADQRLKLPTPRFVPSQMRPLAAAVQCPVQLFRASAGVLQNPPAFARQALAAIPRLQITDLPGSHHLHTEAAADTIAAAILSTNA